MHKFLNMIYVFVGFLQTYLVKYFYFFILRWTCDTKTNFSKKRKY